MGVGTTNCRLHMDGYHDSSHGHPREKEKERKGERKTDPMSRRVQH